MHLMAKLPFLRRMAASVASGWLFFGLRRLLECGTKEQPPLSSSTTSPPSQEGSYNTRTEPCSFFESLPIIAPAPM